MSGQSIVLVCGSRDFPSPIAIVDRMGALAEDDPQALVLHGAARGADHQAAMDAESYGLRTEGMPADWSLGRKAGPLRNRAMLDRKPRLVIAFWDGHSRGTLDTISEATRRGIPVEIVPPVAAGRSEAEAHQPSAPVPPVPKEERDNG